MGPVAVLPPSTDRFDFGARPVRELKLLSSLAVDGEPTVPIGPHSPRLSVQEYVCGGFGVGPYSSS